MRQNPISNNKTRQKVIVETAKVKGSAWSNKYYEFIIKSYFQKTYEWVITIGDIRYIKKINQRERIINCEEILYNFPCELFSQRGRSPPNVRDLRTKTLDFSYQVSGWKPLTWAEIRNISKTFTQREIAANWNKNYSRG